jgi:hypothetical protein
LPPAPSTDTSASRQSRADVEAGRIDAQVAAHDPAELDVADDLAARIVAVHPVLLDDDDVQAQVSGEPVTARVWLDWMPRIDTSVAPLGQRIGRHVLELEHLVVAEGNAV